MGKLQALPVRPSAPCGDHSGPAATGDSPSDTGQGGELNCGTKIPNRDSGIDSPSSSVAGENFPCEELSPGSALLHPETAPGSQTPQEEADSDVGEEADPRNSSPGIDEEANVAQVGPLVRGVGGHPNLGTVAHSSHCTRGIECWEELT